MKILHFKTTRNGFGLIEVLVAVVILTTVITGLSYVSAFMIRSVAGARHKTEAINYTQTIIETLKNDFIRNNNILALTADPSLTTKSCSSTIPIDPDLPIPTPCAQWREPQKTGQDQTKFYLYYGIVNQSPQGSTGGAGSYYRLDARVIWLDSGRKKQVHLTTYLGKIR